MSGDYTALGAGSLFFRAPAIEDLDTIHAIEVCMKKKTKPMSCGLPSWEGQSMRSCTFATPDAARKRPAAAAARPPLPAWLHDAALQVASYPEDEAATCEKLEYRIRHGACAPVHALQGACPPGSSSMLHWYMQFDQCT